MLTTEELLSAAIEACKVSIAINIARLIVETEDEDGEQLSDEQVNENLTAEFHAIADEFDQTLQQILARMAQAKVAASGGLEVVRDPGTVQAVQQDKE